MFRNSNPRLLRHYIAATELAGGAYYLIYIGYYGSNII